MASLPKEAEQKLVEVVDYVSQEVIFGKGDFATAEYFQRLLPHETLRFKLAWISVEVQNEKPAWSRINEKIVDIEEEGKLHVKPLISNLASMMQDVDDLLSLSKDSKEDIEQFRELLNTNYDTESEASVALNTLVDAYEEGSHSEVLIVKPFTMEFLRKKISNWLNSAIVDVGTISTPYAMRIRNCNKPAAIKDQLEDLRKARNNLTRTVKDPLEEAQEIGKRAGGRFLEAKQSARRLEFDEEDLEVDDSEASPNGTYQLSDVPEAQVHSRSDHERSPSHSRKRKNGWTHEQKIAFKAAVADYGVGSWASIRDAKEYEAYWSGKSNVQLKDLYRTMQKKGEIE
mmetsp:Transcript_31991/g.48342  ORF Transcript_31991/g.48342 Transcript_31991/m.48342 type:complete len:343 (+) Transcript_31991:40-1068(+)